MEGPLGPVFSGVDFAKGRLFDTADADEASEVCGRVFNPHRLSLVGRGQRLRARMDHLALGAVSLNRLTWGAQVAVDPDRLGTYYLLSVPVSGSARFHVAGQAHDVSTRCAAIVNADQRFHFETSLDFDQIVVRFERGSVESAWQALTGTLPTAPVNFATTLPLAAPSWHALEPVLQVLAACARGTYAQRGMAHAQARIEDLLITTLLLNQLPGLPGPASGCAGSGGPRGAIGMRRAREHMRDHLDEPLTLSSLARTVGVASRTLQAGFHAEFAMGPMQWLREQRLSAVREALASSTDPALRVTDTALRFGFTHLGEFSRAYRQRFGETPRQTLARRQ